MGADNVPAYARAMAHALRGLDDVAWGDLEDAYGAAVDVPDLLRGVAAGEEHALGTLHGHVFHQGASFYSATPPATRFLVALAHDAEVPRRHEVLDMIAEMTGAQPRVTGFDPYAFRSTRGPDDYPEARDTLHVLQEAGPSFVSLLDDPDAQVRAAAALVLACIGEGREKLADDDDAPNALASRVLARARFGEEPEALRPFLQHEDAGVRACAALALAWRGDEGESLERALDEAALLPASAVWPGFPWTGSFATFAAAALVDRDDALARLLRVMDQRFARGDRVTPPFMFRHGVLDAPTTLPPEPSPEDEALRTLVRAVAHLAFEPTDSVRLREELNDQQRRILRWTVDHRLPVPAPGVPWFDANDMRRFLEGDGLLERPVSHESETRPAWRWLIDIEEDGPALRAVLDAFAPEELIALSDELYTGAYNARGHAPCMKRVPLQQLEARMLEHATLFEDALRRRAANPGQIMSAQAIVFVEMLARLGPLDESADPLLTQAAYARDRIRPCLELLPVERRSRILGRLQNRFTRGQLEDLVAYEPYVEATLATLLSDRWRAREHETRGILEALGEDALDALRDAHGRATGDRAKVLERAIATLEHTARHTLLLAVVDDEVDAELLAPSGDSHGRFRFPLDAKPEHLAPLAQTLQRDGATELALVHREGEAELDRTRVYRLQSTLRWQGMRLIAAGGSSIEVS